MKLFSNGDESDDEIEPPAKRSHMELQMECDAEKQRRIAAEEERKALLDWGEQMHRHSLKFQKVAINLLKEIWDGGVMEDISGRIRALEGLAAGAADMDAALDLRFPNLEMVHHTDGRGRAPEALDTMNRNQKS